ncbi:putative six-hairpin glycosidase familly protein [Crocosphaera subtropica ATCC 51142]|uniref:Six-hairpin glycosidase familly protein n=1 Tax=Crocosphaera subtropica (strain ATCC 51142 / BH68) TaxID=43989 RepID=B1X1G0_CROS5|nr:thioredoxin domain-containing protein [Crocosphaera subtropica]ACB51389.1 putative six-hairpin glycosidase familly protein [Crocosphaera subtropica ATCC 51142]
MPNRLANTQSLYLRKHAENPIDWWYWCEEALEIAKNENKPIFLSIGYSSCHWCTVMEGEAFCDLAIATYLNDNFLPIKVDREERPDLDSIYMSSLQMMGIQGGWPLNIFLTPGDLVPFYGGTYFPVEPRYGRPGFLQVLQSIRRFYDVEKEKLNGFKQEIVNTLQQSAILPKTDINVNNAQLIYRGVDVNTKIIQVTAEDFGRPCFPMIPYSNLALQGTRFLFGEPEERHILVIQRGQDLALGGIFDQVGGGFHRYTVDSTWTVPHFEKMLYDNGQIVEYLANLWSSGQQEPAFERAIALTVQWLQREMTAPDGYFYAAQDADSFATKEDKEPEEGAFYVWEYEQLEQLLTSTELEALTDVFTITPEGNFEGKNVLQRRNKEKLSDSIETILDKLFKERYGTSRNNLDTFQAAKNNQDAKTIHWPGRIPPVTDTKMIVAWNGLMISGLARAYAVFKQPLYWQLACNATQFILEKQWVNGRFQRINYQGNPSILAQSEDYAFFIKALLDLQAANPQDTQWLDKAMEIQQEFDEYFWSVDTGGYYNNADDNNNDLLVRERSYIDNATPSANGIAISNLVRLARLTDNLDYLDKAEQALQAFSYVLRESPRACPSLLTALDWYHFGCLVRTNETVLPTLITRYLPTTAYRLDDNLPNNAIGLVCQGLSCLEPATTQEQLLSQIIEIGQI